MIRLVITIVSILFSYSLSSQCVGTSGQVSWHIWEDDISFSAFQTLFSDDTYGGAPDKIRVLNSTASIEDYDDEYGSIMKGFIIPDESGPYQFNITGDDLIVLFVSDDATYPDYTDTTAVSNEWTQVYAHDDTTTQTSSIKNLVAGQEYYFELYHKEGGGGDHVNLFWDLPGGNTEDWQLITSPFLADVCATCPTKGTPCNDGNASTTDDIEDGYCNCVGTPAANGLSVGDRSMLKAYVYDYIDSAPLSELYNDPSYPGAPSRMFYYNNGLNADWDEDMQETGVLMKGFLTVPADGSYDFNITGVGETTFRINRVPNTIAITDSIFSDRWYMQVYQHDLNPQSGDQSLYGVNLQKNEYYYFELIQKNPDYGRRFMVFWNGPQHNDDGWHRIPKELLYNYEDPMLCVAQGTPCDDGNQFTYADTIGLNCNCIGIPCMDNLALCDDPEANYIKYDYCQTSDRLLPNAHNSWLSCSAQPHPYITEYAAINYHWIHYDLGDEYLLGQTHVWNYNVADSTEYGFFNVAVHYSIDGNDWDLMGFYDWDEATGNGNYSGFAGPDFGNQSARYVVFTSLDQNLSCRGISKITFEANYCQDKGTECDDGDMITYNDHYDDRCQCIGYTLEELDCTLDTLFINQEDLNPNEYHAIMALMSEGQVMNESSVNYSAGFEILLNAGFEVSVGSSFEANIDDCPGPSMAMIDAKSDEAFLKRKERPQESLQVFNLEGSDIQTVRMYLPEATSVSLSLYDQSGTLVSPIINHHYDNYGDHYKRIQTRKLQPGIYTVQMNTPNGRYIDKLTVLGAQ